MFRLLKSNKTQSAQSSSSTTIFDGIYSESCANVLQIRYATHYASTSTPCCCFVLHTKLWKFQPFFRTEENVWPSISCLFLTIGTLTEEDRLCHWFRMSHKRYRNFTKCQQNVSKIDQHHEYRLPSAAINDAR